MPSTVPPSSAGITAASDDPSNQPKPKYVVSSTGHAAHPEDIIESCRALQAHLSKMQEDADRELKAFEERIRERDLAEKRRVAPGWLDSEARILEPVRSTSMQQQSPDDPSPPLQEPLQPKSSQRADTEAGAQLDRAFGGMALR